MINPLFTYPDLLPKKAEHIPELQNVAYITITSRIANAKAKAMGSAQHDTTEHICGPASTLLFQLSI
jgi:hypothetical protein